METIGRVGSRIVRSKERERERGDMILRVEGAGAERREEDGGAVDYWKGFIVIIITMYERRSGGRSH